MLLRNLLISKVYQNINNMNYKLSNIKNIRNLTNFLKTLKTFNQSCRIKIININTKSNRISKCELYYIKEHTTF